MISDIDLKDWVHLDEQPLYALPRNTYFKWLEDYYFFDHIDGMYSYCIDLAKNQVIHLAAAATVTPLRKETNGEDPNS